MAKRPQNCMNLLKKVISLRESNSDPEQEKPFLEHLEDLRKMIFRIVITLLVSMILCFTFQKQLLAVLRKPIEDVWAKQVQSTLPREDDAPRAVSAEQWEQAKKIEQAAAQLADADREAFYGSLDDAELAFHARCVAILRAAKALPYEKQEDFIRKLKLDEELTEQVLALNELNPDIQIAGRGDLKMMSSLKPTETFMLSMKLSFIAGILLALPLLLFYILQFVLPGLHDNERKAMWPALAIGSGLFLSGVCFAYFIVLPRALTFFVEWSERIGVVNDWRIGWYISFATNFTLLFGVAFELPVVVMLFVKLGILSYDIMARTRRYAIVAIFVLAAFITPTPDIMTLCLMALPMILLYECCIWLAFLDRKKQRERDAQEAKEHEQWLARKAQERREAAKKAESELDQDDTTLAGDPYHEHYQDPYGEDEYERDHLHHDVHEYDPHHDDHPEDYNWDTEYDQFHQDAEHDGLEEDESELDKEFDGSNEDFKTEKKEGDPSKDQQSEGENSEDPVDSKDDKKPESDS